MALFSRKKSGDAAEAAAEKLLKEKGCRVLGRNFRVREGEIDLIVRDADAVVFVEVRAKRSENFGTPAESVTPAKQRRIVRAAEQYLARHPKYRKHPLRFDVVGVRLDSHGKPADIEHLADAFGAPGGGW